MAGGSAPFTQEGSVALPDDPSSSLIATALEAKMREVRKARAKKEAVEAPSREFVAAFRRFANTDPETGVLVADIEAVDAMRKSLNNKLSNTNREMLNASIQSLMDSGLTVVFGSPDMIERYEMNNYPKNTVFVFYCDTGKTTKERIGYYKKKFPNYKCVSLKGGRAYFRPNFQLSDDE